VPRFTPLAVAAVILAPTSRAEAQSGVDLCLDAERFVRDSVGMTTVTEPDTIDDWRTQAMVPGCRVTAAGATRRTDAAEARDFYERIRQAGWERTPDPRDAPNEASLRFRRAGADCLFNYYTLQSPLNTEAELAVTDAVFRGAGERIFNFLVLCTPAAPAVPRGAPPPAGPADRSALRLPAAFASPAAVDPPAGLH
jgi:hypothetical protein